MKTMIPFDENHPLQKAYDKTRLGCLCGHSESCAYCDGSMIPAREAIEEAAKAVGYQLHIRSFDGTYHPINPDSWRITK